MKTPYFEKEVDILEKDRLKGVLSRYQMGKLKEYRKIIEFLNKQ